MFTPYKETNELASKIAKVLFNNYGSTTNANDLWDYISKDIGKAFKEFEPTFNEQLFNDYCSADRKL